MAGWLKLQNDFFETKEIMSIDTTPNGKEYILLYLKLLCESINYGGELRFSEQIPYNNQMLSIITDTDINIVSDGLEVLSEYGLVSILANKTIIVRKVKNGARDRNSKEYRNWRNKVFKRDNYTCQECNIKGLKLNAHHIKSWSRFPKARFDVENGITLCEKCHKAYHKENGRK